MNAPQGNARKYPITMTSIAIRTRRSRASWIRQVIVQAMQRAQVVRHAGGQQERQFSSKEIAFEHAIAVVNECRRFGFQVGFAIGQLGKPATDDLKAAPSYWFLPMVEIPTDLPAKVAGRAVFGDPLKNG